LNILLTGYSSKIGYSLVKRLLEFNNKVFIAGRSPLVEFPELNWTPWSLGQKLDTTNYPKIDVVVHLAWQTKFRRENFHLNVGGSLQLLNQDMFMDSHTIFLSSLAALNPLSHYGAGKSLVENECRSRKFEVIRPGLILGAEAYSMRWRWTPIVPAPKTPVYITHLDCLMSELLISISQGIQSSRNTVCKVSTLSDFIAKGKPYLAIPPIVGKALLNIPIISEKLSDIGDSYISLLSTPNVGPMSCKLGEGN
jgi:hypothetical protein